LPKSGKALQWCPCGSNIRPHIAISFAARSLHVVPRESTEDTTVYVCELCVQQFAKAIERQSVFYRTVNPRIRDRFLGTIGLSVITLWNKIAEAVPK
jgi:hypothetical protein